MNEIEEQIKLSRGFKRLAIIIPIALVLLFIYDCLLDGLNR